MAVKKTVKSCLEDVRELRCSIQTAQTKSFILTGVLCSTLIIQHTLLTCSSCLLKRQPRPAKELYIYAKHRYEKISTINTLLASLQLVAYDFFMF